MKTLINAKALNIEMTQSLALQIADILRKDNHFSVFLEGGLGAGKTFMVRKIMESLGIKDTISSPTYTYVNEYNLAEKTFAHFDFYRLKEPNDFFIKGFEEIASETNTSCFSEWVDKISPIAQQTFTGKPYVIRIEFGMGVGMRKIKFLEV